MTTTPSLTRFVIDKAVKDYTEEKYDTLVFDTAEMIDIYTNVITMARKHKTLNPLRKIWIASLIRELEKMIVELKALPNT